MGSGERFDNVVSGAGRGGKSERMVRRRLAVRDRKLRSKSQACRRKVRKAGQKVSYP